MTSFEDRLWDELAERHSGELALGGPPEPGRQRRTISLAAAAILLVGVILAATVGLTAGPSTPAYAITQHPDGTVTLTIRQLVGIGQANARLAKLGIRARSAGVEASCTTDLSGYQAVQIPPQIDGALVSMGRGSKDASVTLSPSVIPAGDTLLVTAEQLAPGVVTLGVRLYRGAVPDCIPAVAVGGSGEGG